MRKSSSSEELGGFFVAAEAEGGGAEAEETLCFFFRLFSHGDEGRLGEGEEAVDSCRRGDRRGTTGAGTDLEDLPAVSLGGVLGKDADEEGVVVIVEQCACCCG